MQHIFFANTDSEGLVSTTSGGIAPARRGVGEFETSLAKSSLRSASAYASV